MKIFKKKNKKYEYKIYFANGNLYKGEMQVESMDDVYKILCKNSFTQFQNSSKAFYWNANNINYIEVLEVKED